MHQQETMTQHPHAVADHSRRPHRTATEQQDLIRQTFPRHRLGSRLTHRRTVFFRTMSGIYGRAIEATRLGETPRHGALWTTKQWKRHHTLHAVRTMCGILRHTGSGIFDVDPHGTTRGHPAGIAATGATRDEKQEAQCSELSGGSGGARTKSYREATGEPRGRRHWPIAITHRMRSRREATRQCTTNDARFAGIGTAAHLL